MDTGICSCTTDTIDVDSILLTVNRGVCDLDGTFDEFLDTGLEFLELRKSSICISSDRGRGNLGLLSRDRDDDERFFEESRDFSPLFHEPKKKKIVKCLPIFQWGKKKKLTHLDVVD